MGSCEMRRLEICFLPLANCPSAVEIQHTLEGLGYPVSVLQSVHEFAGARCAVDQVLVLHIGDKYPHTDVLDLLRSAHAPGTLVVFDHAKPGVQKELTRNCDQFVYWPCPPHELATRLELLAEKSGLAVPGPAAPEWLGEFLNLNLIGRAPLFVDVLNKIKKITKCDAPLLIEGETGTGKELAARAVHYLGARKERAFIPINCGALPETLIENELFGHARGAYTDAGAKSDGLVARAHGGTLFLDEIDSLCPRAQVVLLRFLQDQRYLPLGASTFRQADVRIIAASNQSLADLVQAGRFRQDLYYRLNLLNFRMPALRERRDDIALLAQHFLNVFQSQYQQAAKTLHPTMMRFLQLRDWPGNVRELENFLHREYLLADGDQLLAPGGSRPTRERRRGLVDRRRFHAAEREFGKAKAQVVSEFERQYLCALLEETGGNVTLAAQRARKERRALGKLLKKHGIRREDYY